MSRKLVVPGILPALILTGSAVWADSLPYTNVYEIYLPNPGDVEVSLQTARWTTRVGLAFEEFPNVDYINTVATIGQTAKKGFYR